MQYKSIGALMMGLVAALSLTACGSEEERPDFQAFDDLERQLIEEKSDISGERGYDSMIEAYVVGGYRAVGVLGKKQDETHKEWMRGQILFAQCEGGVTFEECGKSTPSIDKPHAYVPAVWVTDKGRVTVGLDGLQAHWQAKVGDTTLDCVQPAFQLNPYSIKQIPEVLGKFVRDGEAQEGTIEVNLPPNPDPEGHYSMGKITWTCTTL